MNQSVGGHEHGRHLETTYLSSLCDIVSKVIRCSLCELNRDLLYFLYLLYNPIEQCFLIFFSYKL